MDTAAINYDSWSLKNLRGDATKLGICFSFKDGVKTLARKLRTSDRIGESFDAQEGENLAEATLETSLSFEQRFQLQERELQSLKCFKIWMIVNFKLKVKFLFTPSLEYKKFGKKRQLELFQLHKFLIVL